MLLKFITLLLLTLLLSGCITDGKQSIALHISASNYINPDINLKSAPLKIQIYALNSATEFKQASFESINHHPILSLQNSLIDKWTYYIQPGQQQDIALNTQSGTRFLGIVAAYRILRRNNWKKVIPLSAHCSHSRVQIWFDTNDFTWQKIQGAPK